MRSTGTFLIGLLFCAAGICVAVSLLTYSATDPPEFRGIHQAETFQNWLGLPGAAIAATLLLPFGYAAYLAVIPLGFYGVRFLYFTNSPSKTFDRPAMQCAGFIIAGIGFAGLCTFLPDWTLEVPCPLIGPGGYSGTIITTLLASNFGNAGIVIFLTSMILAGFVLVSDLSILRFLDTSNEHEEDEYEEYEKYEEYDEHEEYAKFTDRELAKRPKLVKRFGVVSNIKFEEIEEEQYEEYDSGEEADYEEDYEEEDYEYEFPSAELLQPSEEVDEEQYGDAIHATAQLLEKVLLNFKINARVVDVQRGPVITQYELRLEKGTRIKKIQQLQDDLGVELKAGSVRIVAPIPGKNTVGVELPNEIKQTVRLRDIIEASPHANEELALPLFLGKGVTGEPIAADLAKMPHLLIAGQTGTGKSVCLNSIIVSILMTRSPEQVRMLMVDPKQVEFSPYQKIPHLIHPVVNDMQKAAGAFSWMVNQMEDRFELFRKAGVRNLSEYNKLSEDDLRRRMDMIDADDEEWGQIPKGLPYLVVVVDEVADLIQMVKEVESYIVRLTQKSRAAGIHLILATQKPTRDVFTSLIKTNLPARIAFRVSSKMDSMVILDRTGAEQLLGRGDMLLFQDNEIVRGQGALVTNEEIEAINEQIGTDNPDFDAELLEMDTAKKEGDEFDEERNFDNKGKISRDEMYYQAVDLVIQKGRGSVSMLQTCLGVGYPRASRMMDFMEEDGVVGKANGSKPRDVLVSSVDWRRKRGASPSPNRSEKRIVPSYREESHYEEADEFVAM